MFKTDFHAVQDVVGRPSFKVTFHVTLNFLTPCSFFLVFRDFTCCCFLFFFYCWMENNLLKPGNLSSGFVSFWLLHLIYSLFCLLFLLQLLKSPLTIHILMLSSAPSLSEVSIKRQVWVLLEAFFYNTFTTNLFSSSHLQQFQILSMFFCSVVVPASKDLAQTSYFMATNRYMHSSLHSIDFHA